MVAGGFPKNRNLSLSFSGAVPYANVLQNRCYWKFCNIHRKTSVLESLFNKVVGLGPATLFQPRTKRDCNTGVFL